MLSEQCDELRRLADGQASYRDAREAMLRAADTIWELRNKCAVLRDENEKLRELVRHMWRCFLNECADGYAIVSRCGECPYNNDDGRCDFECRMRELGIEVDE